MRSGCAPPRQGCAPLSSLRAFLTVQGCGTRRAAWSGWRRSGCPQRTLLPLPFLRSRASLSHRGLRGRSGRRPKWVLLRRDRRAAGPRRATSRGGERWIQALSSSSSSSLSLVSSSHPTLLRLLLFCGASQLSQSCGLLHAGKI